MTDDALPLAAVDALRVVATDLLWQADEMDAVGDIRSHYIAEGIRLALTELDLPRPFPITRQEAPEWTI